LKKEYVVTQISAPPDGSPYVFVSLRDPKEVGMAQRGSPASIESFSSMDDVFTNLGHIISRQMMGSFATVIKLSLEEYERLDIKVGDRMSLDIEKAQMGLP